MAKITAISSLGWAHYTLYEALPRMAARGFRRIEIASFSSYCFHFNFGSPTPAELRTMLDDYGLEPVCLNYSPGLYSAWIPEQIDLFVEDCRRKIAQLGEVGIPMMTMSFGVRNDRPDQEHQLSNAVKAYNQVGEIASDYGVRMLLEVPHLYNIMFRTKQVLWVFERLECTNIGALVDSSHWGIIGYDSDAFLGALGERLWHVHLRDSAGPDTADRKQELELTPGDGTADFAGLARALDAVGYAGDVTTEFEYRDMTLAAIDAEYDRGLTYLQEVGWELPEGVRSDLSEEKGERQ
jgi:sugar phosphate isomerase/epimerase